MGKSTIAKELENLTGKSSQVIQEPKSIIGKILWKKLGHQAEYEPPQSVIGQLIEELDVGGGGEQYEEVLLYENPDTSASMKGGTKVIDFNNRQDSLSDYDYLKIIPWAGNQEDSWRWFVVPAPKTVGNKNVECAINQNVSGTGQCVRMITVYPPEAPVLSQANSIIAWAVFYTDGKVTETAWAVPWKIYGIKKK